MKRVYRDALLAAGAVALLLLLNRSGELDKQEEKGGKEILKIYAYEKNGAVVITKAVYADGTTLEFSGEVPGNVIDFYNNGGELVMFEDAEYEEV